MGLFDRFKKKAKEERAISSSAPENLENLPGLLMCRLLFEQEPRLNADRILEAARKRLGNVEAPPPGMPLVFSFPDFKIEFTDAAIPAQCVVMVPDKHTAPKLPEEAFQQNWHWPEAGNTARNCRYELMVTDFLSRTMPYPRRAELFMDFLAALIEATGPDAIYSVAGEKLIDPAELIHVWSGEDRPPLYGICNVRLYNISNTTPGAMLMDTVGLHILGLPDVQLLFSGYEPNDMAGLLWSYAEYIYDNGDVIESGNTLEGLAKGSKWKCERMISQTAPERIVINVQP